MVVRVAVRVGKRIKELREELGLTQEKLAFEIDMGKGHMSKLERGLQDPGITTLSRIAARLGVGVWDLVIDPAASPREQLVEVSRLASATAIGAATRVLAASPDPKKARRGATKA